jgi:hypothetical protein
MLVDGRHTGLWRAVKLQRATAVKHLLKRGANWRIPGPDYRVRICGLFVYYRHARLQDLLFACLCYRQTKNEKKDAVFNILIAHGVVFQQKVDFFFFFKCLSFSANLA